MPTALGDDPFSDKQCPRAGQCIGPGTCTDFGCIPRGCTETVKCRGAMNSTAECAMNVTIQGQTCQILAAAGLHSGGDDIWVSAATSDGNVDAFNLPNTWSSSSVDAHAQVGALSTGDVTLTVYRSTILSPGPRGGPLALVADDPNHEWRTFAINAHKGTGTTSGEDVIVGLILLDSVPEGCYVRTGQSSAFECPRVSRSLP